MLTLASFVVKIFGFIYVIPFVAMVGQQKYILFEYAYKPYIILLSVATLGIPNAVSKFVSKYREKQDYHTIRALLYSGTFIVFLMGLASFLALYLGAEVVASWLVDPTDPTGNSIEDVTYVIRMISYALIIVPLLAMTRGFIQGYQSMGPTAISQIIEQIVRIAIILVGTYVIVNVLGGSEVEAVGLATFSAFLSAVVALGIVIYYLFKRDYNLKGAKGEVSYFNLYKELVVYAIPFVFVGLAIPIFQSIDTFMINNVLMGKGYSLGNAEMINSLVSLIQKIVVIPVALATAFSVSLVAYITKAHQGGRIGEVRNHINQAIKVMMLFLLPAVGGMLILARPIFGSIFGVTNLDSGGTLLCWYAASALFYSVFSVTAAILQGMDQQKWVVFSLIVGVVAKVLSNYPLILLFDGVGTAISTYIGFAITIAIQMYFIQKVGKYKWSENLSTLKHIAIQTLVMMVVLSPISIASSHFDTFLSQLTFLAIGLIVAGLVYFTMAYRNGTLFEIISKEKVDRLLRKNK